VRFRRRTPHLGDVKITGGINTYAYVGGNPVAFTDPDGLKLRDIGRELGGISRRSLPDTTDRMATRYENAEARKDGYSTLDGPTIPLIPREGMPVCQTVCPNDGGTCKPLPTGGSLLGSTSGSGCYTQCFPAGIGPR
jgi:hypothetical protein